VTARLSYQAAAYATAPQGNVTQASHEHATRPGPPSSNATHTVKSGEAAL
jgi:hypothetical protein